MKFRCGNNKYKRDHSRRSFESNDPFGLEKCCYLCAKRSVEGKMFIALDVPAFSESNLF